jgi:hypothetical protein
MSHMLIWVMLCVNGHCGCERIGYRATEKEISIISHQVEITLKNNGSPESSGWVLMKSDTSYYYVQHHTSGGLFLSINHLKGGHKAILIHPKRIDYSIIVQSNYECFHVADKEHK